MRNWSPTPCQQSKLQSVLSKQGSPRPKQASSQQMTAPKTHTNLTLETQMVNSQVSAITQLTEQVSILQLVHNKINSKLNILTEFIMAQNANNMTSSQSKCKAAGGLQGSPSQSTWWCSAVSNVAGSSKSNIVQMQTANPPPLDQSKTWMSMLRCNGLTIHNGATRITQVCMLLVLSSSTDDLILLILAPHT